MKDEFCVKIFFTRIVVIKYDLHHILLKRKAIKQKLFNFLKELIAPTRCAFCGYYGALFCEECKIILEKIEPQCPVCRKPNDLYLTHSDCKKDFYLDSLVVCYEYNDVAKKLIESLKYKFDTSYAKILVDLMLENDSCLYYLEKNNNIVPVPLHEKRHKWRGFNQAELICDEIMKFVDKYTNLNIENDYIGIEKKDTKIIHLLIRTKNTVPQAKLKREKRLDNLKDAFDINESVEYGKINDVLIFDDVTTTTSTLNECAKVLKENGVKNVVGVVFARGV
ncbi:MAG: ComF family protein [bacterium]